MLAHPALTASSGIARGTTHPTARKGSQGPNGAQVGGERMAQTLMSPGLGNRASQQATNLRQLVEAYERRLIIEALVRAHGNQRRAAAELGCLPTTLNEKMRRLGLRSCDQRMLDSGPEPELMGHA